MSDPHPPQEVSTFRLRRRTPGSFLLVPCAKLGRAIRCQGQLEAATAVILAACPRVANIQEQPLTIWYAWQGFQEPFDIRLLDGRPRLPRRQPKDGGHSYIVPDFLVTMTNGARRLVEVKPSSQLQRPIVRRKLAVAHNYASRQGWAFYVITEKGLWEGPLLGNVRRMNRYRQAPLAAELLEPLVAQVPADGIELAALISRYSGIESGHLTMHVLHLSATGRLSFDPCLRAFDPQTVLFPGGTIPWDPFDSVWAPGGSSTGGPGSSSANSPPTASWPKTSSST